MDPIDFCPNLEELCMIKQMQVLMCKEIKKFEENLLSKMDVSSIIFLKNLTSMEKSVHIVQVLKKFRKRYPIINHCISSSKL